MRDNVSGTEEKVDARLVVLFIGAAPRTEWLDGVAVRDSRGFVVAGPDLVVDGKRPRGWPLDRDPYHLETSIPGVFVAGDVRAESVEAGGLRRRRGRHGGHPGAQISGEAMTNRCRRGSLDGRWTPAGSTVDHRLQPIDAPLRCSPDELRTLFLFEKLTDEQLDWLCREGHVE